MEETQGVVGSAETGSPSRGTLASLREASTTTSPAESSSGLIKVVDAPARAGVRISLF